MWAMARCSLVGGTSKGHAPKIDVFRFGIVAP
jgi:hypothetical protein